MGNLCINFAVKPLSKKKKKKNPWTSLAVQWLRIYLPYNAGMEKAMAPHSSTLAWKIPWMEEPGGLQPMGSLRVGTTERLHFHVSLSCIGEGSGNPLQCSCLENPRDGGAWWAAVYGVAQSQTGLKRLSSSSSIMQRMQVQSLVGNEDPTCYGAVKPVSHN